MKIAKHRVPVAWEEKTTKVEKKEDCPYCYRDYGEYDFYDVCGYIDDGCSCVGPNSEECPLDDKETKR